MHQLMHVLDVKQAEKDNFVANLVEKEIQNKQEAYPFWMEEDKVAGYLLSVMEPFELLHCIRVNINEIINECVDCGTCCVRCKGDPCVWEENWISMMTLVSIDLESDAPNNEKSRFVYRQMCRLLHGALGGGKRVKLPQCVISGVRNAYPNSEGEYMGFRAE